MDIASALAATPTRGAKVCVIQRWLNGIPDDTPHKDELEAALVHNDPRNPEHKTRAEMMVVLGRLGLETTVDSIGDHRGHRCRCYR